MNQDVRLFHVSDVHFGVEDQLAHDWFADAVRREKPNAVICTGDITQRARKSQFAAAAEWFLGMDVPVVLQPGNHDMPYYNLLERFRTPFRRYETLKEAIHQTVELPGIVMVPLLTTVSAQWRWPWSDGVIRERALAETLANLDQLEGDSRLKLVLCHHPLVGRELSGRNPTRQGGEAFAALARAGADIVLSGHVHDAFDITHELEGRKLRMVGAGTLSTRLRSSPPSFNVMTISGDGDVAVERRELVTA
jgi:3',5'-cyclic AMP phosphodiesterase CpdA